MQPDSTQPPACDRRTYSPTRRGRLHAAGPAPSFCWRGPSVGAKVQCASELRGGASLRKSITPGGLATPSEGAHHVQPAATPPFARDRRTCSPPRRAGPSRRDPAPRFCRRDPSVGATGASCEQVRSGAFLDGKGTDPHRSVIPRERTHGTLPDHGTWRATEESTVRFLVACCEAPHWPCLAVAPPRQSCWLPRRASSRPRADSSTLQPVDANIRWQRGRASEGQSCCIQQGAHR